MDTAGLELLLERLTGEPVPFKDGLERLAKALPADGVELGYSQLNELLLVAGLDRITRAFFAYLLTGEPEYSTGMAFESLAQLEQGVQRFRAMALLSYGNIKFAFKSLSHDETLLRRDLENSKPISPAHFERRHHPLLPLDVIPAEDAYLTGYIIEGELRERLKNDSKDELAASLEKRRLDVVERAVRNQEAYYASDHLDVYVATSMRARHEFLSISRTVHRIFSDPEIKSLKLRWFDPTQAYCRNRINKGLAEALMLRRASCTIYLAQEVDTLGKDSELASTLAQGKPVIAFVPEIEKAYFDEHVRTLVEADERKPAAAHLLEQLRLFEPGAAWLDPTVRSWCEHPESAPLEQLRERLFTKMKTHYDSRARTLRETHPLGIQVNLQTGVANGVLVVRTIRDCARLVRGIVTRTLEFDLVEDKDGAVLRERVSQSIFRVMTSDAMLTNTFWNFYLEPVE